MPEPKLVLFTGPGCHLCEQAEQLCWQVGVAQSQLRKEDVTQRLEWKKAYGLRIPVLLREDSAAELGWPFDAGQLKEFLSH